jgi:hypothetical protein
MLTGTIFRGSMLLAGLVSYGSMAVAQKVEILWDKVELISKTTPTLQVVVNPPLRRGSAIHDRAFAELKKLGADYVRYVPWLPYPKLAVAELQPPGDKETSWDFSLIDPMTIDFLEATEGHPVILNFSTIPAWMFITPKPVTYPQDPDAVTWNYTQGAELHDSSMKTLGGYYARLVSWYVDGGFIDEAGKRHESGYHFQIPYWEVLNEVDSEHSMTPEQYTARYDAVVSAIRQVAPKMKFVGLALAGPSVHPEMFEYFLDPRNHKPGIPLDMISYHFYATPASDESPQIQQHTFFDQADGFLNTARYVEAIRKRLSPQTETAIDEIGCISADDGEQDKPGHVSASIPSSYWNLCGATFAYVFANLATMGVEVAGESQLVGYPTQYPSVSLLDWNTGAPNARFRVLQLLKDNFGPGDKIVATRSDSGQLYALAFLCRNGDKRVLLINKRDRVLTATLPQKVKQVEFVDNGTKSAPPLKRALNDNHIELGAYSVTVATLE